MAGNTRPLDLSPYRGEIAAAFDTPGFTAALKNFRTLLNGPDAAVLLDGRNKVRAVRIPSASDPTAEYVFKDFGLHGLRKLRSLVQPSPAAKAWRGANALKDRGFLTPSPVAFLERRRRGFVVEGVFVAERVSGGREVRALFRDLGEPDLKTLLAGLAPVLRSLHDRGLVHRDLSDGNVLVRDRSGRAAEFFFLDTNRIRLRRRVGRFSRARNLVRLGVPPAGRSFFLARYEEAGTKPIGPGFAFWYHLGKKSFARWVRFKKALRLRRIARKLKLQ
jgi:hypothetical protein